MKLSILSFLTLLLISCDNTEQYLNIKGEWQCTEWIVPSTGEDLCHNNKVSFHFKEDLTYNYVYSSLRESGVYKIANGALYTTPEGKLEIGVKINKLTQDSLQVIMSRAGDKELLTLLKKK